MDNIYILVQTTDKNIEKLCVSDKDFTLTINLIRALHIFFSNFYTNANIVLFLSDIDNSESLVSNLILSVGDDKKSKTMLENFLSGNKGDITIIDKFLSESLTLNLVSYDNNNITFVFNDTNINLMITPNHIPTRKELSVLLHTANWKPYSFYNFTLHNSNSDYFNCFDCLTCSQIVYVYVNVCNRGVYIPCKCNHVASCMAMYYVFRELFSHFNLQLKNLTLHGSSVARLFTGFEASDFDFIMEPDIFNNVNIIKKFLCSIEDYRMNINNNTVKISLNENNNYGETKLISFKITINDFCYYVDFCDFIENNFIPMPNLFKIKCTFNENNLIGNIKLSEDQYYDIKAYLSEENIIFDHSTEILNSLSKGYKTSNAKNVIEKIYKYLAKGCRFKYFKIPSSHDICCVCKESYNVDYNYRPLVVFVYTECGTPNKPFNHILCLPCFIRMSIINSTDSYLKCPVCTKNLYWPAISPTLPTKSFPSSWIGMTMFSPYIPTINPKVNLLSEDVDNLL